MKNSMEIPQKIKNRTTNDPAIPLLDRYLKKKKKKKKNTNLKRYTYFNYYNCLFTHLNQILPFPSILVH